MGLHTGDWGGVNVHVLINHELIKSVIVPHNSAIASQCEECTLSTTSSDPPRWCAACPHASHACRERSPPPPQKSTLSTGLTKPHMHRCRPLVQQQAHQPLRATAQPDRSERTTPPRASADSQVHITTSSRATHILLHCVKFGARSQVIRMASPRRLEPHCCSSPPSSSATTGSSCSTCKPRATSWRRPSLPWQRPACRCWSVLVQGFFRFCSWTPRGSLQRMRHRPSVSSALWGAMSLSRL